MKVEDNEDDTVDFKIKDIINIETTKLNTDILKRDNSKKIKPELFQNDAEDNFYRFVVELSSKRILSSIDFYQLLVNFIPLIDKFFEDVMVMDENPEIRNNRLTLLNEANNLFLKVADFTKIIKQ